MEDRLPLAAAVTSEWVCCSWGVLGLDAVAAMLGVPGFEDAAGFEAVAGGVASAGRTPAGRQVRRGGWESRGRMTGRAGRCVTPP